MDLVEQELEVVYSGELVVESYLDFEIELFFDFDVIFYESNY